MNIEKKGKTADIFLSGDLTGESSNEFVKKMNELVSEDIKRFNIDFTSVSHIDSYSLSNIIVLCDKPDLEFTFRKISRSVAKIFDVIKLNKQVLIE